MPHPPILPLDKLQSIVLEPPKVAVPGVCAPYQICFSLPGKARKERPTEELYPANKKTAMLWRIAVRDFCQCKVEHARLTAVLFWGGNKNVLIGENCRQLHAASTARSCVASAAAWSNVATTA
jgi:hypothetical protein